MKKGVFGTWFKELASLIFTQTVQAFLLAIVMSIIVNALSSSTGDGATYGAGLLAIIALSQFGKIELLIKNIFGVTSQFGGSMQDGKGGLFGSLMALQMGKNVLNNIPKAVGGTRDAINAHRNVKNLKMQKNDVLKQIDAEDAEAGAQSALNGMGEAADKFIDDAATGAGMQAGANMINGGSNNVNGSGLGVSSSQIDQLISALKDQTSTLKSQKADSSKQDSRSKLADIDKQIQDARNKRRSGIRTALSGVTETIGAGVGAAAGGIVGLGMGDDVVKNMITGAGVGDKAVGVVHNAFQSNDDYYTEKNKLRIDRKDINRVTSSSIAQSEARKKSAEKDKAVYNSVTSSLNKASEAGFMKNRTSQDRAKAVKRLQENAKKKIDASNM